MVNRDQLCWELDPGGPLTGRQIGAWTATVGPETRLVGGEEQEQQRPPNGTEGHRGSLGVVRCSSVAVGSAVHGDGREKAPVRGSAVVGPLCYLSSTLNRRASSSRSEIVRAVTRISKLAVSLSSPLRWNSLLISGM
jgi:hypothetical protein